MISQATPGLKTAGDGRKLNNQFARIDYHLEPPKPGIYFPWRIIMKKEKKFRQVKWSEVVKCKKLDEFHDGGDFIVVNDLEERDRNELDKKPD